MGKAPASMFYPADWVCDTAPLSLAARGAWIDLLCAMWRANPKGQLTHTLEEFARIVRATEEETERVILEIVRLGIADLESLLGDVLGQSESLLGDVLGHDRVTLRDTKVTLINRRMSRQSDARRIATKRQQKYRISLKEKGCDARVTPMSDAPVDAKVTVPSSFSSSLPLPPHSANEGITTDFCAETKTDSSPAPLPAVAILTFPCDGKRKTWDLTEAQLAEWKELFPSLDLLAECRNALAWVRADPSRKKTANGMAKFLVGWFGRSQNKGHANGNGNGKHKPDESFRDKGALRGTPEQEAAERLLISQVLGGADDEEGFGCPDE